MRRIRKFLPWLVLAGCTGQVPSNNALPKIDGSQLTGVKAASVDGATEQAEASTVVKRDPAGNFSAGTITATLNGKAASANSAAYARGQLAATVPTSGVVTVPANGDYFVMSGAADVTALAPEPEGTRVRFKVTGAPILRYSAAFELLGKKDYRAGAGDIFEFMSQGSSGWTELSRRVAQPGDVSLVDAIPIAITAVGATTPITFGSAGAVDELSQMSGFSVFHAYHGGLYQITVQYVAYTTSWAALGPYCDVFVIHPSGILAARAVPSTSTSYCTPSLTTVLNLLPGQTVSFTAFTPGTTTAGILTSININYLRIVRIGN